jgi:hypothetical protein
MDSELSIGDLDIRLGLEIREKPVCMPGIIPFPGIGDEVRGQAGDRNITWAGCLALEDTGDSGALNSRT